MPQLSLYIDKELLTKVEQAAKAEHQSVSGWVQKQLKEVVERAWPPQWYECFGSLADTDLERPEQPRWEDDAPREKL